MDHHWSTVHIFTICPNFLMNQWTTDKQNRKGYRKEDCCIPTSTSSSWTRRSSLHSLKSCHWCQTHFQWEQEILCFDRKGVTLTQSPNYVSPWGTIGSFECSLSSLPVLELHHFSVTTHFQISSSSLSPGSQGALRKEKVLTLKSSLPFLERN